MVYALMIIYVCHLCQSHFVQVSFVRSINRIFHILLEYLFVFIQISVSNHNGTCVFAADRTEVVNEKEKEKKKQQHTTDNKLGKVGIERCKRCLIFLSLHFINLLTRNATLKYNNLFITYKLAGGLNGKKRTLATFHPLLYGQLDDRPTSPLCMYIFNMIFYVILGIYAIAHTQIKVHANISEYDVYD